MIKLQQLELLYYELENIDWNYVTKCKTYDHFLEPFRIKMNKICPLTKVKNFDNTDG